MSTELTRQQLTQRNRLNMEGYERNDHICAEMGLSDRNGLTAYR